MLMWVVHREIAGMRLMLMELIAALLSIRAAEARALVAEVSPACICKPRDFFELIRRAYGWLPDRQRYLIDLFASFEIRSSHLFRGLTLN